MQLLGVFYGIATFCGLKSLQKPMKRVAVMATSHMFDLLDRSKEVGYNLKEGFEDMIAEAQYENLKRHQTIMPEFEGEEEKQNV